MRKAHSKNGKQSKKGNVVTPLTENEREELIAKAMRLWKSPGATFRSLPEEYRGAIEECEKMGVKPPAFVTPKILREYPRDAFLSIKSEERARRYIASLANTSLVRTVEEAEVHLGYSYFHNFKSAVYDLKWWLRHRNDRRCQFGVDPNSCQGKGKRRSSWKFED
ncbi:hypothetical protein IIY24_03110 [Candidatus Saccharibacteria bacterium]|nr:hypothetical protein [Candidatus Saccharibacteria bacterium]